MQCCSITLPRVQSEYQVLELPFHTPCPPLELPLIQWLEWLILEEGNSDCRQRAREGTQAAKSALAVGKPLSMDIKLVY